MPDFKGLSDRLFERVINGVYGGEFSPEKLPPDLYNQTLDRLTDGILSGFGAIIGDDDAGLMIDFFNNVNVFSAAKTHQQIKDMSAVLFDADGFKVPFAQFKEKAGGIFGTYNENWLKTEYNTAAGLAQAGRKWRDVERDAEALPLLKFDSSGDDRVRDHHKELDGIVKPVGDKFWDKYFPPLDWNCRCVTIQLEQDEEPETNLDEREPLEDPPELFKHNPAKSRYIFDEKVHPYFKVEDRYKSVEIEGTPIVPPKKRKPTKAPLPKKIAEKIPTGGLKTRSEIKDFLFSTIEKESGLKAKAWKVEKSLSLESLNRRVETLTDLFKGYDLDVGINIEVSRPTFVFESTKTFYGQIHYKHAFQIDKNLARKRGQGIGYHRMNFGDSSDGAGSRKYVKGNTRIREKSRVDEENLEIATTVHEFAHVIAVDDLKVVGVEGRRQNAIDFFNELGEIRSQYYAELRDLTLDGKKAEMYDLHLGKYAGTNLNEFMAEAFTEYKLSSAPSKYATKAGELIDKYYKRK